MAQSRPQWLADLSRSFKRHRHGRPGWSIEVNRERLRVVSSELPPRPGEQPTEAATRRALTYALHQALKPTLQPPERCLMQ
jgi:hypothetical protein